MFFDFAEKCGVPAGPLLPLYNKYLSDACFAENLWQKLFCGYESGYGIPLYREAFVPRLFFSEINGLCTRECLDRGLFFLAAYTTLLDKTHQKYRQFRINDDIFFDTAKLIFGYSQKNHRLSGKHGLSDYRRCAWYPALAAFRIGSLEYQAVSNPYGSKAGLEKDQLVVKIHVPDGADISASAREDSYISAYSFFSEHLGMNKITFSCESWLLSHEHKAVLPESNISGFCSDFNIIEEYTDYDTGFLCHVFGSADISVPHKLPEKTRLQKHYKNKLLTGEPFYSATGIFEMGGDGIRKK